MNLPILTMSCLRIRSFSELFGISLGHSLGQGHPSMPVIDTTSKNVHLLISTLTLAVDASRGRIS